MPARAPNSFSAFFLRRNTMQMCWQTVDSGRRRAAVSKKQIEVLHCFGKDFSMLGVFPVGVTFGVPIIVELVPIPCLTMNLPRPTPIVEYSLVPRSSSFIGDMLTIGGCGLFSSRWMGLVLFYRPDLCRKLRLVVVKDNWLSFHFGIRCL